MGKFVLSSMPDYLREESRAEELPWQEPDGSVVCNVITTALLEVLFVGLILQLQQQGR